MPYVNNKGADQPALIQSDQCLFFRCMHSVIPLLAIAEFSRPKLVSSAEQASLGLNWSQTLKTGFLVTWLIYYMCKEQRLRQVCTTVQSHQSLPCLHTQSMGHCTTKQTK